MELGFSLLWGIKRQGSYPQTIERERLRKKTYRDTLVSSTAKGTSQDSLWFYHPHNRNKRYREGQKRFPDTNSLTRGERISGRILTGVIENKEDILIPGRKRGIDFLFDIHNIKSAFGIVVVIKSNGRNKRNDFIRVIGPT